MRATASKSAAASSASRWNRKSSLRRSSSRPSVLAPVMTSIITSSVVASGPSSATSSDTRSSTGLPVARSYSTHADVPARIIGELELLPGSNHGTVFAPLDDPEYFAQVRVDSESRTVTWPSGVDLDPAVLHGDFEPAGVNHFREVPSPSNRVATA